MNNAVVLQHCVAIEDQQFMIQGMKRYSCCAWCSHVLGCVHGWSSCKLSSWWERCWEGYYFADLSSALMDGCDPAGILKLLGVALCNLWDHCVSKIFFIVFKPRTQNEQCWFLQASANAFFLVLSAPDLYCSSNLRRADEDMSYSHNYRHSISLKSLWREKIAAS